MGTDIDWAHELGLTWQEGALVLLAGLGIYATVIAYTRLAGQRSIGTFSTFDFAVTVAMGALIGRVVLVRTTLAAGALGLAVLFLTQRLVAFVRHRYDWGAMIDNRPVLLVSDGRLLEDELRAAHVSFEEIAERLRLEGLGGVEQAACVVLERNGELSVVPRDVDLDPELFTTVQGRERLPV